MWKGGEKIKDEFFISLFCFFISISLKAALRALDIFKPIARRNCF
jgi:hypothetical protein